VRLWPRRHGTSLDLLVVGLGNPGREHAGNRHNVGFMVVEELARRHDGAWRGKFDGLVAEVRIDGHKVALLEPQTFMNESGRSVAAALRFFKLEPDAVLVVHDDGDLELGRLQARLGGGLAGHNGLRSIAKAIGTPEFLRLRVGVGRPCRGDRRSLADYVLADFEPHDDRERLVAGAVEAVELLDAEGLEAAQQQINGARGSDRAPRTS
jgi:peptidyl-tRNA hydrolase, PTH1 family